MKCDYCGREAGDIQVSTWYYSTKTKGVRAVKKYCCKDCERARKMRRLHRNKSDTELQKTISEKHAQVAVLERMIWERAAIAKAKGK